MARLHLLKELLSDDGVIFVSIDDNEQHHLRMLMDEIFGESSFLAELVWKSRQNIENRNVTGISIDNHEYMLCAERLCLDRGRRDCIRIQTMTPG